MLVDEGEDRLRLDAGDLVVRLDRWPVIRVAPEFLAGLGVDFLGGVNRTAPRRMQIDGDHGCLRHDRARIGRVC